jgi:hypothetical protein
MSTAPPRADPAHDHSELLDTIIFVAVSEQKDIVVIAAVADASKLGMPLSSHATASPSLDDQREPVRQVVAGAAVQPHAVAVLAGDDAKPSCLISCSQASPVGGCGALVGRQGGTKPGGRGMARLLGRRRGACQRLPGPRPRPACRFPPQKRPPSGSPAPAATHPSREASRRLPWPSYGGSGGREITRSDRSGWTRPDARLSASRADRPGGRGRPGTSRCGRPRRAGSNPLRAGGRR